MGSIDNCGGILVPAAEIVVHQFEEGAVKGQDGDKVGDGTHAHRDVGEHPQPVHIGHSSKNYPGHQIKPLQDFHGALSEDIDGGGLVIDKESDLGGEAKGENGKRDQRIGKTLWEYRRKGAYDQLDAGFAVPENTRGQDGKGGDGADHDRIHKHFKGPPHPLLERMRGVGRSVDHWRCAQGIGPDQAQLPDLEKPGFQGEEHGHGGDKHHGPWSPENSVDGFSNIEDCLHYFSFSCLAR